ncbi:unnamed protein product, partial [Oppiella nova]
MSTPKDRINTIARHLQTNADQLSTSSIPKKRESLLKWNGWGYKDSKFEFDEKNH